MRPYRVLDKKGQTFQRTTQVLLHNYIPSWSEIPPRTSGAVQPLVPTCVFPQLVLVLPRSPILALSLFSVTARRILWLCDKRHTQSKVRPEHGEEWRGRRYAYCPESTRSHYMEGERIQTAQLNCQHSTHNIMTSTVCKTRQRSQDHVAHLDIPVNVRLGMDVLQPLCHIESYLKPFQIAKLHSLAAQKAIDGAYKGECTYELGSCSAQVRYTYPGPCTP